LTRWTPHDLGFCPAWLVETPEVSIKGNSFIQITGLHSQATQHTDAAVTVQ